MAHNTRGNTGLTWNTLVTEQAMVFSPDNCESACLFNEKLGSLTPSWSIRQCPGEFSQLRSAQVKAGLTRKDAQRRPVSCWTNASKTHGAVNRPCLIYTRSTLTRDAGLGTPSSMHNGANKVLLTPRNYLAVHNKLIRPRLAQAPNAEISVEYKIGRTFCSRLRRCPKSCSVVSLSAFRQTPTSIHACPVSSFHSIDELWTMIWPIKIPRF